MDTVAKSVDCRSFGFGNHKTHGRVSRLLWISSRAVARFGGVLRILSARGGRHTTTAPYLCMRRICRGGIRCRCSRRGRISSRSCRSRSRRKAARDRRGCVMWFRCAARAKGGCAARTVEEQHVLDERIHALGGVIDSLQILPGTSVELAGFLRPDARNPASPAVESAAHARSCTTPFPN